MRQAFATPLGSPTWRIPFAHRPPYCAGPAHGDTNSMRDDIIPLCLDNNIRSFFSGREHSFQCLDSEDAQQQVRCFITGGAGRWREVAPDKARNGFMHAWGGNAGTHFLIVTLDGLTMTVEPLTAEGQPLPLMDRQGQVVAGPVTVSL